MTEEKKKALLELSRALSSAHEAGLFDDELPLVANPDIINGFIDAVSFVVKAEELV